MFLVSARNYLQHVRARLLDDENQSDADRPQNNDRKFHEDVGGSSCERGLDKGFNKVFQHHGRH